jgi:hypothetical protein
MRAVAIAESTPAIESPFTETITSPISIPARAAGDRAKTRDTRKPRFTSLTLSPTPEN